MGTISVIIATRNRPALFAAALRSVAEQTDPPDEIIVVNDGSDDAHRDEYLRAISEYGNLVKCYSLMSRPRGHGQSYSFNFGVAEATSQYVAFLDDDDTWSDLDHLRRAKAVLRSEDEIDLYMANQHAFSNGQRKPGPIWIEDLADLLAGEGREKKVSGAYSISIDDLLRCTGFCHLNALIIRREFYDEVGGMDEGIRWECDRDLFLRLIDRAREIRYSPEVIGRHNVPDAKAQSSMTTSLSDLDRRLYQLRVLDRAILFSEHRAIRDHARDHKAYALKRITEALVAAGRKEEASFYAREALGAGPNLKWAVYASWQTLRALTGHSHRK
jgi:glycosyltransferase involved in cell wall biosynthesis